MPIGLAPAGRSGFGHHSIDQAEFDRAPLQPESIRPRIEAGGCT